MARIQSTPATTWVRGTGAFATCWLGPIDRIFRNGERTTDFCAEKARSSIAGLAAD